jgi:hypothetical protein
LTVTFTVLLPVHPLASVTFNVYVVVVTGAATGFEIVVLLSPVAGVHEYVDAAEDVSCVLLPVQMEVFGLTLIVAKGFTVTVVAAVLIHPLASVTVRE